MNKDYLPEKIKNLQEYVPNKTEYRIRLDANESPFKPSEKITEQFCDVIKTAGINRYPDPYAKEMISKYAAVYGINPANVIAGNGSDELISIICNSFLSKNDKILCVDPDFSMYKFYSELIEANIINYEKTDGYKIDFDELKTIIKKQKIEMIIFSNPCNPTGVAYDREVILNFIKEIDCLAVIDEAYMEYCMRECSVLTEYDNYNNLIILKTLSKIGFAGLRVGFAVACETLINGIRKVKSPYNVNMISQMVTSVILDNYDEIKNNIETIVKNRELLYNELVVMKEKGNFKIHHPDGNFISILFKDPYRAGRIYLALLEKGISIRYIKPNRFRITVGIQEEIEEFVREFETLI